MKVLASIPVILPLSRAYCVQSLSIKEGRAQKRNVTIIQTSIESSKGVKFHFHYSLVLVRSLNVKSVFPYVMGFLRDGFIKYIEKIDISSV